MARAENPCRLRGAALAAVCAAALAAAAGGCRREPPVTPADRALPAPPAARVETEIRDHIVHRGDTILTLIRKAGNVDTVGDVVARNRLRAADDLRIGQLLQVKTRVGGAQDRPSP